MTKIGVRSPIVHSKITVITAGESEGNGPASAQNEMWTDHAPLAHCHSECHRSISECPLDSPQTAAQGLRLGWLNSLLEGAPVGGQRRNWASVKCITCSLPAHPNSVRPSANKTSENRQVMLHHTFNQAQLQLVLKINSLEVAACSQARWAASEAGSEQPCFPALSCGRRRGWEAGVGILETPLTDLK